MVFKAYSSLPAPDTSGTTQEEIKIPVRDGTSIRALLFRPENPKGDGPLAVFFHGGGWLGGIPEYHTGEGINLAKNGCVSISVDYRMAPEYTFPTAVNDSWDALKWAHENAKTLGADPSKGFIIGGASAGANISSIIALLARDEGISPPITGVSLFSPVVVHPEAVPEKYKALYKSYEQCRDAPVLDKKAMDFLLDLYKPIPTSPLFSSLLWPTGHKNLPPHYISVCGLDPLRDDGLIYNEVLKENGVSTKLAVYPGLFHTFVGFRPDVSAAQGFIQDAGVGMLWLFSGGQ
ncbi:hypothetical protein NA57DRAFT_66311 [Rhizodiscina lignyota]|uniref:Alpha/beta hydrolase fold-3 domain-containing protein n=1 Tax=Rhizodiscina lignyota TaxID=1504668 RepID=A0A9P4M9C7_9PEZI|nr:hypothetical protein NA57DRAFT_66311 [Rhizodiscina lignyota]